MDQALLEKIGRYLDGTATTAERLEVEQWFEASGEDIRQYRNGDPGQIAGAAERTFTQLQGRIDQTQTHTLPIRKTFTRFAVAASILVILSAGAYFLIHQPVKPTQVAAVEPEELAPVNKGIILKTGNGKTILLASQHQGAIQTADGAQASQSDQGLSYQQLNNEAAATHTLTNNSNTKYTLTLADGTEVYLDVQSSITYPVAFIKNERNVTITGQAYFKVKHDPNKPFKVIAANETIEDIGTEFNVNAYSDETNLKTTLVQGAININYKEHNLLLKPGEQAITSDASIEKSTADLEKTLAWLQNKQIFNREPLENIMKRIARIYDVQLVWVDPDTRKMKFGGSFDQTKKLSTVLNFLRKVGPGVDFAVEGKTVKIFKKKS